MRKPPAGAGGSDWFKKYNEKYLKPQLLEYRNKMSRFKIMALLENSSIVEDARRRQTMLEKGEF